MSAKQTRVAKIIASSPPLYAAIDLGTNSCRLLIAKATPNGISIIDAYSKPVRLGEGLSKSGILSKKAQQRTLDSLKIINNKLRKHNIVSMRAVATEACRQASNAREFLDHIKNTIGLDFEIIDNKEEARLASDGCKSLLPANPKNALIFDIGGGSTQLAWIRNMQAVDSISIPYGVTTLTDKIEKDFLSSDEMNAYVKYIQSYMHEFHSKNLSDNFSVLGTSGTITTLTGTALNLKSYNRSKVDGKLIKQSIILDITKRLASIPSVQRQKTPCIGTERSSLLMAGCVILNAICTKWHSENILVADRGIREGILLNLIQSEKNNDQ